MNGLALHYQLRRGNGAQVFRLNPHETAGNSAGKEADLVQMSKYSIIDKNFVSTTSTEMELKHTDVSSVTQGRKAEIDMPVFAARPSRDV
jgi:2,4-dienoyl-CoA reductase-like NADH-dependent reductase (Old Yellow Enzyme family)